MTDKKTVATILSGEPFELDSAGRLRFESLKKEDKRRTMAGETTGPGVW